MPSCLQRDTGGDRDPKRREKREIIPNTTLPPPENFLHHKMGEDECHLKKEKIINYEGQSRKTVSTDHKL